MTRIANNYFVYNVKPSPDEPAVRYLSPLNPADAYGDGLPPEAVMGELSADADDKDVALESYKQNAKFLVFLHVLIARHGAECPALIAEAERQQDGVIYVVDRRTPDPTGDIPKQDIIGAATVEGAKLVRFHGSPEYRTYTEDGFMQLDPWLHEKLVEELKTLVAKRKQ